VRTLAKSIGASVFCMLGIVLLVAGKSTAGAALACSALLMLLPVSRLMENNRLSSWLRVAAIAVLCAIAVQSIAGTDIVPEQRTTGYDFVDQVLAILRRFRENIVGAETT
jgi:hypothetical protein